MNNRLLRTAARTGRLRAAAANCPAADGHENPATGNGARDARRGRF
jgi:hypothetical protein